MSQIRIGGTFVVFMLTQYAVPFKKEKYEFV